MTTFPHLSRIADPIAQESLRLLWEDLADLDRKLASVRRLCTATEAKATALDDIRRQLARIMEKAWL